MSEENNPKKRRQTRLSRDSFASVIVEMLAGPCTAQDLCRASGMTHRYILAMLRTMREKQAAHVSGWEKDSVGRIAVATWSLGAGKDAARPTKPRQQVNAEYRANRRMDLLKGTPFYGIPMQARKSPDASAKRALPQR